MRPADGAGGAGAVAGASAVLAIICDPSGGWLKTALLLMQYVNWRFEANVINDRYRIKVGVSRKV